MQEVENAGQLHGYKYMHLKCIQNGFTVTQITVSLIQHIIEPAGVICCKRNISRRRSYLNPHQVFQGMLTNDNLKPFGICVIVHFKRLGSRHFVKEMKIQSILLIYNMIVRKTNLKPFLKSIQKVSKSSRLSNLMRLKVL